MAERLYGVLPTFDLKNDDWNIYKGQINLALKSLKIAEEDGTGFLLCYGGSQLVSLIYNICSPKDATTVAFKEIIKQLDEYFVQPTNIYTERKNFYDIKNIDGETSQEFMLRLKKAAAKCEFGNHLEFVLCDKFVTSIKSNIIFNKICDQTEELTVKKIIEIAKKCESRFSMKTMEEEVHAVSAYKKNQRIEKSSIKNANVESSAGQSSKNSNNVKCSHCGYKNHSSSDCRYKNLTCRSCNKIGHLARICKSKRKTDKNHVEENASNSNCCKCKSTDKKSKDIGYLDDIYTNSFSDDSEEEFDNPIEISIRVFNQKIKFLVDTGAKISAIPYSLYHNEFADKPLIPNIYNAKGYGGHTLEIMGAIEVPVKFNNIKDVVKLYVIRNGQRPILGRNFLKQFKIKNLEIYNVMHGKEILKNLISSFEDLFSEKLGLLKNVKVSLDTVGNVQPVFVKARKIPYALVESVEKELKKLESDGIIEKIETTEWGTPLVPILKENGQIRICADYKVTLNKFLKDTNHPLPHIEDILYKLRDGKIFSKLDLAKAYNQIELDDKSKCLAAWSTHLGNYRMNRLPFGVKPATGIFQREIEKILHGINNVTNFLDDIIVSGATIEEHNHTLQQVLGKIKTSGLKLNKHKCEFGKEEIVYLGYKISNTGIIKVNKNNAIEQFPVPTNITDVKSFCGLANYFGKNIEHLATKMFPLYSLLKKGNNFSWNEECQNSFEMIKHDILADKTMVKFNPDYELLLTCDASGTGLGAILAHKLPDGQERPIEFASRTLNAAELNYSTIEKEALAIIYGTKKFFKYLIGRKFILVTDHKPLLKIFGQDQSIPQMSTSRLQRWAYHLSIFNYEIRHIKSEKNCADCLSRYPVHDDDCENISNVTYLNLVVNNTDLPIDFNLVLQETKRDKFLQQVITAVREDKVNTLDKTIFQAFITKKDELYIDQDVLMWGYRVVIPEVLRTPLLQQIHCTHLGIVKTKSIIRSYIWWPRIDHEIEQLIKSCESCLMTLPNPSKAEVMNWEKTERQWSRIHIDFAGPINGYSFFIMIDSFSKWIEVNYTKTPSTEFCIKSMLYLFARFGIPDKVVSDNGTQFTSEKFEEFLKSHGIQHSLTATYYPATNGAAENAVKTIKNALKSAEFSNNMSNIDQILCRFLTDYRNSEHCTTKVSPASAVLNYKPKIKLDLILPPAAKMGSHFDEADKSTRSFEKDDDVMIRNYRGKWPWKKATILKKLGPRMYRCKLENNIVLKRHINQIRPYVNSKNTISNEPEKPFYCEDDQQNLEYQPENARIVRFMNPVGDIVRQNQQNIVLDQPLDNRNTPDEIERISSPTSEQTELIIDDELDSFEINNSNISDSSEEYYQTSDNYTFVGSSEGSSSNIDNPANVFPHSSTRNGLRDRSKIRKPERYQD